MQNTKKLRSVTKLLVFSLGVAAGSCANPGEKGSTDQRPVATSPTSITPSQADAVVAAGGLTLSIQEAAKYTQYKVYVVGEDDRFSLRPLAGQDGVYELIPTLSGRHDLIVLANLAGKTDAASSSHGIRLSGIEIPSDKTLALQNVSLSPTLDLKGKILLQPAGAALAEVSVVGTSFKVSVDASGNYTLPKVPIGNHEIKVTCTGYQSGNLAQAPYSPGSLVPNLTLFADTLTLDDGLNYFGATLAKDTAVRVTLGVKAPDGYTSMRYGTSSDLSLGNWENLRTSIELNLKEQERAVFIQFSRDGRQPSSIFSKLMP